MDNVIHLQGIGKVKAIPAEELKAGMHVVYNYGYTYEVLSVEPLSPAFLNVALKASNKGTARDINVDTDRVYYRKVKRSTLVGIAD